MLHGRGGSADDILSLAPDLAQPNVAFWAPQAAQNSWYPYSFLAPIEQNEPWLTSALNRIRAILQMAAKAGIAADRVVIAGFSQGACLATEFVARNPRRYAGLVAFTGGLIGPPEADLSKVGDLAAMPAFFGSGDPDPHVPWTRVEQSARILEGMGAIVTSRRYVGRPHTITDEELVMAKTLIRDVFAL